METKMYRITLTLHFDIDAISKEDARDRVNTEAKEWLSAIQGVEDNEIEVEEIKS